MHSMTRRIAWTLAAAAGLALASTDLTAQQSPAVSIEPYVGYGFYGSLPDGPNIEGAPIYGGRLGVAVSPRWGVYGRFQTSNPDVTFTSATLPGAGFQSGSSQRVSQWAAGVEYDVIPVNTAPIPITFNLGAGQAQYEFADDDLAVNLGLSSAIQLAPALGVRLGASNFVSDYRGNGLTHQLFLTAGAELSF
jgi:hypothetical protein